MPIDVTTEELIPELPFIPRRRRGRRLHPSTVFRWAQRGIQGVRLEVIQFAGTKCTTLKALNRFLAELSELAESSTHTKREPNRDAHNSPAVDGITSKVEGKSIMERTEVPCTRCGNAANHVHQGQPFCELCRGCHPPECSQDGEGYASPEDA